MTLGVARFTSDSTFCDRPQRNSEARLIARRVLEAREVDDVTPDIQLAMQFVLVAALSQSHDFASAREQLKRLIRLVFEMQKSGEKRNAWSYEGSRDVTKNHLTDPAEQRFIVAVLDYIESLGSKRSPDELRGLLRELEHQVSPNSAAVDPATSVRR